MSYCMLTHTHTHTHAHSHTNTVTESHTHRQRTHHARTLECTHTLKCTHTHTHAHTPIHRQPNTYAPPTQSVRRASFWVASVIGAGVFVIIVIIALAAGLRHSSRE